MNFAMILAQTGSSTTAPTQTPIRGIGDFISSPMGLILCLMMVVFWFMSSSKRNDEKKRKEAMSAMKKGDRVQTIGGILGTIVETRESEIVVKVDETNNTKIKFARSAILKVVGDDDKPDTASK
jgi:preprotein translocase subunit YajC